MDSERMYMREETSQPSKLDILRQWLIVSKIRLIFLVLLLLVFIASLTFTVIIRQTDLQKKAITVPPVETTIKTPRGLQSLPTIPFSSPTPDATSSWTTLVNANGFMLKYPPQGKIITDGKLATTSATLQVLSEATKEASAQATLAIEVIDKTTTPLAAKTLLEIVDLIREMNTKAPTTKKILTRPIAILIGGYEGFEWYLDSAGFAGFNNTFFSKPGKNRVIQFEKNNNHYILFSTLDDEGEQLRSTVNMSQ